MNKDGRERGKGGKKKTNSGSADVFDIDGHSVAGGQYFRGDSTLQFNEGLEGHFGSVNSRFFHRLKVL